MSVRQGSTIVAGINSSNYNDLSNKPQINSIELSGNKTLDELSIQSKLVAGENITIDGTTISATGLAKTDLSNISSNIDYVVESQEPTSGNGYTWYRLYKSGLVEQGGWFLGTLTDAPKTITLPIEMMDTDYSGYGIVSCNKATDSGLATSSRTTFIPTSTTQITLSQVIGWRTNWQVSGQAAQGSN